MSYPMLFEMYLSVHFIFEGKKAEDKLIPYSCYNVWFDNFLNVMLIGLERSIKKDFETI